MRSRWLRAVFGLVAVLLSAYVVLALLARPAADRPFFAQGPGGPLVMAHRGGKGLWPENTLYAFDQAVALGVDVLEMDIRRTAEGVLVVLHDDTVDRTTDGTGAVDALSLEEVKALDAGYNWTPDDGQTFPYRGQGITVPTLAQVFAAYPAMPMNVEIKPDEPALAAPLCQLIRDSGVADRVLIASFHADAIRAFRQACPEVATTTAESEVIPLFVLGKLFLEGVYGPRAEAVQVPEYQGGLRVLTPRFVDAAHRRGLQVHAWTINDADDMRRLLDLGLDGIITDYPDRLMEVLGRQ
jgi:glycerophosphoryl diester phosphodiesterase